MNTKDVKAFIRRPYTWPGGYPMFLVMNDGGTMCKDCARSEWPLICDSIRSDTADGWSPSATMINWEDTELSCDHCYRLIESVY